VDEKGNIVTAPEDEPEDEDLDDDLEDEDEEDEEDELDDPLVAPQKSKCRKWCVCTSILLRRQSPTTAQMLSPQPSCAQL
jgi:hypothetical protein